MGARATTGVVRLRSKFIYDRHLQKANCTMWVETCTHRAAK